MSKFLSIIFVAAFLMVAGIATASAHCDKCGDSHATKMQPCEKSMGEDKPCKCKDGAKEPCEMKMGEKKPCNCKDGKKKSMQSKGYSGSNVGSLQMQSRGKVASPYND